MTPPRRFHARPPVAFALAFAVPFALATAANAAQTPQQPVTPITAPSPAPMPTVTGTPLPYPAYGTPAPDVAQLKQRPGVPVQVTLAQAIDIAVVQSPTLASESAAYREIAARVGAELGALFPSLSGSASITRDYGRSSTGGTSSSATPPPNSYETSESAGLSISQLIFDGGRAIAAIHSAKEADVAGKDTLLRQFQTLSYTVAQAYYTLLEDEATVASDNALVREFELNEQYVTAQIRTGAAARSDLAAAQFETAQARGSLVTAQGQVIVAEATFATTLGLNADTQIVPQSLPGSPKQEKLLSYQQSLQEAYTLRPDYLSAEYTVDSDKENLRYAKLARFPTLTANGTLGTARALVPGVAAQQYSGSQSLGASLSVPIYDQGLTNYNVAVAAGTLDQAIAAMTLARLTVQSDVRGGLATLISARASLVQAQAEIASATVSLQATQAQYRVGASTITAVVTAEANLATAQAAYISALYTERLAETNYEYVMGANDLAL
jgi:outer membrane protein